MILKRIEVVLVYSIMLRPITAQPALLQLQDISADCSELDHTLTNDEELELDSNEEDSYVDNASEDDDCDSQNQA